MKAIEDGQVTELLGIAEGVARAKEVFMDAILHDGKLNLNEDCMSGTLWAGTKKAEGDKHGAETS